MDQILPLSTSFAIHDSEDFKDTNLVHLNKTKKKNPKPNFKG